MTRSSLRWDATKKGYGTLRRASRSAGRVITGHLSFVHGGHSISLCLLRVRLPLSQLPTAGFAAGRLLRCCSVVCKPHADTVMAVTNTKSNGSRIRTVHPIARDRRRMVDCVRITRRPVVLVGDSLPVVRDTSSLAAGKWGYLLLATKRSWPGRSSTSRIHRPTLSTRSRNSALVNRFGGCSKRCRDSQSWLATS